jgi:hypothetical protein
MVDPVNNGGGATDTGATDQAQVEEILAQSFGNAIVFALMRSLGDFNEKQQEAQKEEKEAYGEA